MSLVVAAAKTDKGVAGGRRRRGGAASAFASAECPHPQCALPRKAFCIFAATCINVDKKLLPLQVPQCCCCWLPAAACCKNGNIIMRQTLNCRSYLCPEFGRATRAATATATVTVSVFVFEFEFSLAISICNWQKAEWSGVEARRAALSTRCGACHSLWQVGCGWHGVVASLSVDCHYYHYQQ